VNVLKIDPVPQKWSSIVSRLSGQFVVSSKEVHKPLKAQGTGKHVVPKRDKLNWGIQNNQLYNDGVSQESHY
jgi:hypothetical protein